MQMTPAGCMSKDQLLSKINLLSFAVNDITLYLDGHPDDTNAYQYFMEKNTLREEALLAYAKAYGPLTIATASEEQSSCFAWVQTPWPWELHKGGRC